MQRHYVRNKFTALLLVLAMLVVLMSGVSAEISPEEPRSKISDTLMHKYQHDGFDKPQPAAIWITDIDYDLI